MVDTTTASFLTVTVRRSGDLPLPVLPTAAAASKSYQNRGVFIQQDSVNTVYLFAELTTSTSRYISFPMSAVSVVAINLPNNLIATSFALLLHLARHKWKATFIGLVFLYREKDLFFLRLLVSWQEIFHLVLFHYWTHSIRFPIWKYVLLCWR